MTEDTESVDCHLCNEKRIDMKIEGKNRREHILKILQESEEPVPGYELAEKFGVSRQVVVQDIALLRAADNMIMSTHVGYLLENNSETSRVFKVRHGHEKMLDELNIIVDCGGRVDDVFVYHKLYGVVRVKMNVKSRRDAKKYVESVMGGVSLPLEEITSGYHYHTVWADDEESLDIIQGELDRNGFLVALRDYEPVDFWSEAEEQEGITD